MYQVTVLMALFQGAEFLGPQLDSIAAQAVDWRLVVGDDGSDDSGPAILNEFARAHPHRVGIRAGPGKGAGANFIALLAALPEGPGFVALSDQDDVWHPDKLARAVGMLLALPPDPALYCSRVTVCDRDLQPRGLSRWPRREPSFRHALVQNLVQGNTVVLNPAAAELARRAGHAARRVVMHDWWLYQLVTGAGGTVIHDPRPSLLYRQHGANAVGANIGLGARLVSLQRMFSGQHRQWSRVNLREMARLRPLLTAENQRLLDEFILLRGPGMTVRLAALRRAGFYRQGAISQAAFWAATVLRRV